MQPAQMPPPRPAGRSGLSALTVVAIVLGAFVLAIGAISTVIVLFFARQVASMGEFSKEGPPGNSGRTYPTLADSLPASHEAAKALVELSHKQTITVSEDQPYKDSSGNFKGYLEFGYSYSSSGGTDFGFGSSQHSASGSFSTLIAPNHMYFADFKRLKVGQQIQFEEIPTNNLPKVKLSKYDADPFLFVRPVAIR